MKVLDLQCTQRHFFEGWFASENDFQTQLLRGLVECPLCADKGIQKMPSAPRLNLGALRLPGAADGTANPGALPGSAEQPGQGHLVSSPEPDGYPQGHPWHAGKAEQAAFLAALRHVVANTEDVGDRFALEARRMHYGEQEPRSIRGQTTAREAVALLDEGIDVMPFALPAAVKETLQ